MCAPLPTTPTLLCTSCYFPLSWVEFCEWWTAARGDKQPLFAGAVDTIGRQVTLHPCLSLEFTTSSKTCSGDLLELPLDIRAGCVRAFLFFLSSSRIPISAATQAGHPPALSFVLFV